MAENYLEYPEDFHREIDPLNNPGDERGDFRKYQYVGLIPGAPRNTNDYADMQLLLRYRQAAMITELFGDEIIYAGSLTAAGLPEFSVLDSIFIKTPSPTGVSVSISPNNIILYHKGNRINISGLTCINPITASQELRLKIRYVEYSTYEDKTIGIQDPGTGLITDTSVRGVYSCLLYFNDGTFASDDNRFISRGFGSVEGGIIDEEDIVLGYVLCGSDGDGNLTALINNYKDDVYALPDGKIYSCRFLNKNDSYLKRLSDRDGVVEYLDSDSMINQDGKDKSILIDIIKSTYVDAITPRSVISNSISGNEQDYKNGLYRPGSEYPIIAMEATKDIDGNWGAALKMNSEDGSLTITPEEISFGSEAKIGRNGIQTGDGSSYTKIDKFNFDKTLFGKKILENKVAVNTSVNSDKAVYGVYVNIGNTETTKSSDQILCTNNTAILSNGALNNKTVILFSKTEDKNNIYDGRFNVKLNLKRSSSRASYQGRIKVEMWNAAAASGTFNLLAQYDVIQTGNDVNLDNIGAVTYSEPQYLDVRNLKQTASAKTFVFNFDPSDLQTTGIAADGGTMFGVRITYECVSNDPDLITIQGLSDSFTYNIVSGTTYPYTRSEHFVMGDIILKAGSNGTDLLYRTIQPGEKSGATLLPTAFTGTFLPIAKASYVDGKMDGFLSERASVDANLIAAINAASVSASTIRDNFNAIESERISFVNIPVGTATLISGNSYGISPKPSNGTVPLPLICGSRCHSITAPGEVAIPIQKITGTQNSRGFYEVELSVSIGDVASGAFELELYATKITGTTVVDTTKHMVNMPVVAGKQSTYIIKYIQYVSVGETYEIQPRILTYGAVSPPNKIIDFTLKTTKLPGTYTANVDYIYPSENKPGPINVF